MNIIKVIVDEMPEGCGYCDEIESREKGRDIVYECHFVPGFIKNQNVRLPNCPLVSMKRFLKLWEYAETGNWDYEVKVYDESGAVNKTGKIV